MSDFDTFSAMYVDKLNMRAEINQKDARIEKLEAFICEEFGTDESDVDADECGWCEIMKPGKHGHGPDCPWLRARAMVKPGGHTMLEIDPQKLDEKYSRWFGDGKQSVDLEAVRALLLEWAPRDDFYGLCRECNAGRGEPHKPVCRALAQIDAVLKEPA